MTVSTNANIFNRQTITELINTNHNPHVNLQKVLVPFRLYSILSRNSVLQQLNSYYQNQPDNLLGSTIDFLCCESISKIVADFVDHKFPVILETKYLSIFSFLVNSYQQETKNR